MLISDQILFPFILGGILLIVWRYIYNFLFHPLAKVPGPAIAKLTNLWLLYQERGGDASNTLLKWHKSHGKNDCTLLDLVYLFV